MAFAHGITITTGGIVGSQIKTGGSAYPVVFGCAYGPTTPGSAGTDPVLISSFAEYVEEFGWGNKDDGVSDVSEPSQDYSLDLAAWVFFKIFKTGPFIAVNVYTAADFAEGVSSVAASDIGSAMEDGMAKVFSDIGFPPSHLLAPRYSKTPALKTTMKAFNDYAGYGIMICVDGDDDPADSDSNAKDAVILEADKITDDNCFLFWPEIGGYPLSLLAVASECRINNYYNDGVPFDGPSNKPLYVNRLTDERTVSPSWVDALNTVGVVTWLRRGSQTRLWGPYSLEYDSTGTADYINDTYIPRRMMNYIIERINTEFFDYVDAPLNLRKIEDMLQKLNQFGTSLIGKGAMLGFNASFLQDDNPIADLQLGKVTLKITLLMPREMSDINFDIILDLNFFNTLFG